MKVYNDKEIFRDIFARFDAKANMVRPRGQLVREVENFSYELPPYVRFQNFASRKMNLSYFKREMLWYLKGERFDTSICDHAKIWRDVVNKDGSINSNYGQYVFSRKHNDISQFDNVINVLCADKDSRRASIVILNNEHLLSDTNDVPCTYALNFRIRHNELNMSVHMRSQDAIFGMGSDAPAFSIIHEMVLEALRIKYLSLKMGYYFHSVDSFHVYERHWGMLEKIIAGDDFEKIECPKISGPQEVEYMMKRIHDKNHRSNYEFSNWLLNV
jgi:thymidylate synthase